MSDTTVVHFAESELVDFCSTLLTAGGFTRDHAERCARLLVWANGRGMDSHGVLRIPRYVEMVQTAIINPAANLQIVKKTGAITILEADGAPGVVGMEAAMDLAVTSARDFGIGWCSARNITHAGAVGYYALAAADAGCIGIVLAASAPMMAYFGSKEAGVSTNPIAIAVPMPDGANPLLLDMSTSTVSLGKIMAAKDAQQPIPEDWGLDADGRPTTNPGAVETLLPLGGAKGSGLSLMIELLVSVLASNSIIAPALNGSKTRTFNGVALALDIRAFVDIDVFRSEVSDLATAVKSLAPAPDAKSIMMPGERGYRTMQESRETGIPLAKNTLLRLTNLASQLGVVRRPIPLVISRSKLLSLSKE